MGKKDELINRISLRTKQMIKSGLIDETIYLEKNIQELQIV